MSSVSSASFDFTKAEFDQFASVYDDYIAKTNEWVSHMKVSEALIRHADSDARRVIDLGTGTGLMIPHLQSQFAAASILGVDLSKKMIEQAVQKGFHADFMQVDLREHPWPLQSGAYNIATASGVMEFVKDTDGFVSGTADLLQDSGLAVLTYQLAMKGKLPGTAAPTFQRTKNKMEQAFASAGMEILEHSEFIAYRYYGTDIPYGLIAARKHDCV